MANCEKGNRQLYTSSQVVETAYRPHGFTILGFNKSCISRALMGTHQEADQSEGLAEHQRYPHGDIFV